MTGYLLVHANGSPYGLRLDQVVEVIDGLQAYTAPSAHPAVRGVAPVKERLVPLVHLGALIGNRPAPSTGGETAVLVRCVGSLVALEVEDADAVIMDQPTAVPEAWQLPWACGVARHDSALVPIIDVDLLGERLVAVDLEGVS